jgi:hypothetical protein
MDLMAESPSTSQDLAAPLANPIGLLNESPLHAALKDWYARPGDRLEVPVGGFVVDIVRNDLLIEIQTGSFCGVRSKLQQLTRQHAVRLVYPVAQEKWILKQAGDGQNAVARRKSPKRGTVHQVFDELVSFPDLVASPNFSLEVILIQEEEVRHYDGRRGWRRGGWVIAERRLVQVLAAHLFQAPADLAALLPEGLEEPFTTKELAAAIRQPRRLAQRMAYCLRAIGILAPAGHCGRAVLYTRTVEAGSVQE